VGILTLDLCCITTSARSRLSRPMKRPSSNTTLSRGTKYLALRLAILSSGPNTNAAKSEPSTSFRSTSIGVPPGLKRPGNDQERTTTWSCFRPAMISFVTYALWSDNVV